MLDKEKIVELLETLREHKMAKEIFVPVLQRMGLNGVKFTGGSEEQGIDIEYYEYTQPEHRKNYVGVQFKKGSLVYGAGGSKGTVKEVKNHAEEAFEKEIHDIDDHSTQYIQRFVVAITGDINETARKVIGRARQKGSDRRIDYWTGDRLAEYIQDNWMDEFEEYFEDELEDVDDDSEEAIVDEEYLKENYKDLINRCKKVQMSVAGYDWRILETALKLSYDAGMSDIDLAELLIEMGRSEDYLREEFNQLAKLGYMHFDESSITITGHAGVFYDLLESIDSEIEEADEAHGRAWELFEALLD